MRSISSLNSLAARLALPLRHPFALGARLYVAHVFIVSGLLKVQSWPGTLGLFRDEYHVPLLPPVLAAYAGTFGELFFPALLVVGLFSRYAALGLFFVNAMAVISYRQVLLSDDFAAALGQHVLWGAIAAYLVIHGPGLFSLDHWLARRTPAQARR